MARSCSVRWVGVLGAVLVASASALVGCDERPLDAAATTTDAGVSAGGLSAELASRVVAKVGDKAITLGDFAQALERMNEFDRLRYQTKERRRELLNDMIDVELLTQEAQRRGLDKRADVQDSIRQILREAMLSRARADLPAPAEIPASEIRAYFDAHPEKFSEPERRRVSAIVLGNKKDAAKVLAAAEKVKTAGEWGALFEKHSSTAKKGAKISPVDLAGDLGIVGPPSDSRGANGNVPQPVREAVFQIPAVGSVASEVVEADGLFFVVRMSGKTDAHTRTVAESDRSIRVALLQEKMQEREQRLEDELRRKFPVEIDERALAKAALPGAVQNLDAASKASAYGSGAGSKVYPGDGDDEERPASPAPARDNESP